MFTKHENKVFWEYNQLFTSGGKLFESSVIPQSSAIQYPLLNVTDLKENESTTTHNLIKEGNITLNIVTIHRLLTGVLFHVY
jgi:hypothetical protein